MQLTLVQLNKISPAIVGVRGQLIVDAINKVFPIYGMLDAKILQSVIPNMLHESREFSTFEENMNYSVQGLLKTFSRNRISKTQAEAYGRIDGVRAANKQAIANTVYGGSWGSYHLGNTLPNDGWELRGSGAFQGTGRKVLTMFTAHNNRRTGVQKNVYATAAMLRDKAQLDLNMHFVCWFVKEFKGILYLAEAGRFSEFCVMVNGGNNGKDAREKHYLRARQVLA